MTLGMQACNLVPSPLTIAIESTVCDKGWEHESFIYVNNHTTVTEKMIKTMQ